MKHKAIVLILLSVVFLVSCSDKGATPTDILYSALSETDSPDSNIYFSEAANGSDECIESDRLKRLYAGISPEGLYSSSALSLSRDDSVYEIHIYKGRSEADAIQIEKILCRRVDLLHSEDIYIYDEDNYENVISAARVGRKGRYAYLLITDKNDEIESIVRKSI